MDDVGMGGDTHRVNFYGYDSEVVLVVVCGALLLPAATAAAAAAAAAASAANAACCCCGISSCIHSRYLSVCAYRSSPSCCWPDAVDLI